MVWLFDYKIFIISAYLSVVIVNKATNKNEKLHEIPSTHKSTVDIDKLYLLILPSV